MKMRLAVLCAFLGGCSLYWPGGNGDDVCAYGTNGGAGEAVETLINPDTGSCQSFSDGGDCDNSCGPCSAGAPEEIPADWAQCTSGCNGLDQTSCEAAAGCHAFFVDQSSSDGGTSYWECEAVAPNGPVETACDGLDSQDCSDHDNCISIYENDGSKTTFESCAAENPTTCGADGSCGAGSHCAQECTAGCSGGNGSEPKTPCMTCSAVCVPDQVCGEDLSCPTGYDCAQTCVMSGDGSTTCSNLCIPDGSNPGTCTSTGPMCAIAAPACPVNTVPGILDGCWSGYCIPSADCGPGDPGTCTSSGPMCNMAPPACPPNTTPGITDGCWSGYCIPDAACPTPDCTTLTTESACEARSDCAAVFTGMNCTCDANGTCTCDSETFSRCEGAGL